MYSQNKFNKAWILISGVLFILSACYKESDYYYSAQDILEHLIVKVSEDSILADGSSHAVITYEFPADSDTNLTQLFITASNGTFMESEDDTLITNVTRLDDSKNKRVLEATLVASTVPGKCIITTKVLNYIKKDTVVLTFAPATSINVSSTPDYLKNDTLQEIIITATTKSETGLASIGRKVDFYINKDVGFFTVSSSYSEGNGKATAKYIFTDTAFTGTIEFTAATNGTDGTITGIDSLRILD